MKLSLLEIQALDYLLFCYDYGIQEKVHGANQLNYKIVTLYKEKIVTADFVNLKDLEIHIFRKVGAYGDVSTESIPWNDTQFYLNALKMELFDRIFTTGYRIEAVTKSPSVFLDFLVNLIKTFDRPDLKQIQENKAYNVNFLESNLTLPFVIMDENEYEVISLIENN